ncbi:MAG: hypothetical protein NT028_03195 [candidate division Zixibacteria bacterium]|nr:hypothetical protein [candidate division Zixibacteria bacterium]
MNIVGRKRDCGFCGNSRNTVGRLVQKETAPKRIGAVVIIVL